MPRRQQRTRKQKKQKQQRGGDYGFSGPAFMTAAGAPVESRMDQIDCMMVDRPAPVLAASYGGARRSRKQRQQGGACGCDGLQQRGGGGGTGGYSVDVGANDIGKMYSALIPGNCATVPSRAMVGGSYGLQSYTAGYDMNRPVEIPGGSAHYLDWSAYDKTCRGGARRLQKNQKKQRKSRRS
jgi:hypothetical protein